MTRWSIFSGASPPAVAVSLASRRGPGAATETRRRPRSAARRTESARRHGSTSATCSTSRWLFVEFLRENHRSPPSRRRESLIHEEREPPSGSPVAQSGLRGYFADLIGTQNSQHAGLFA